MGSPPVFLSRSTFTGLACSPFFNAVIVSFKPCPIFASSLPMFVCVTVMMSQVSAMAMKAPTKGKKAAADDEAELRALAAEEGYNGEIEAWDWRYYAEQVRKERYALDEAAIKQYMPLDGWVAALFDTTNKLYGITAHERKDVPVYADGVRVWELREALDLTRRSPTVASRVCAHRRGGAHRRRRERTATQRHTNGHTALPARSTPRTPGKSGSHQPVRRHSALTLGYPRLNACTRPRYSTLWRQYAMR